MEVGFYRPLGMAGATRDLWERNSKQQSWFQAMFQVPSRACAGRQVAQEPLGLLEAEVETLGLLSSLLWC